MSHKKLIAFVILINYFQTKVFCFVDLNSVQKTDRSSVIFKNVTAKTNYKLIWDNFTDGGTSAQMVVSLPPKLRLRQQLALPVRHVVKVDTSRASFRIREASGLHEGFYTAYKLINDTILGQQFLDERRDFYIHIIGLAKEGEECGEDSGCESNYCINNRCVCNKHNPIPIDHKCYSSQPIGTKCLYSSQCKFIGGNNSECNPKGKCRCIKNSFTIDIPYYGKYCVEPKNLNDSCTYSEECQVIGNNRYCNQNFTCNCIPDYRYQIGIGCVKSIANISPHLPTINKWILLLLLITAIVKL